MRRSILACGLLLALAGMSTAVAAAAGSIGVSTDTTATSTTTTTTAAGQTSTRAGGRSAWYWRRHLARYHAGAERWLTVIRGRPVRRGSRSLASHDSAAQLRQLAKAWYSREHAAWRRAKHPPLLRDWNCIHHYEGSWTDHGAPYWGGLQMDYSFQSTYGGWLLRHKGTADHWTSLEQIWVAVRAWRVRGFSPWPNTARDCGVY
jgi:hypothetical protein